MAQRQDLINNALQKLKNTAQSLGRGTTNFINKAPGAIGQFGSENFIQPTVKSTYQASKPILDYLDPRGYSKNDTGKLIGAAKAAPMTALNLYGLSRMKPAATAINYGIGGLIGMAAGDKSQPMGQRFLQGGRKGLEVAPTLAAIGSFTNPLIEQGASTISSGFTNPLIQQAISRGATGLMNIPEGMLMKKSMTDEKYNLKDAAFDFGIGALTGGYKPKLRVKGIDKGAVFENPQAKRIGQLAIKFDKEGNLSIDEIDEVTKLAAEKLDVPRKQLNKMNPGQMLAELQGLFTKNQDYAYTNLPRNQGMTMGLTYKKLYKSGEIPPPPKVGSGEQILEEGLGFKPGMKREFDLAMLTKDKAKITALLPDIPESYKAKFKSDIDTIMGKPALRTSVPKGSYTNIPGADNPLLNKSSEDPFIKGLEADQGKPFKDIPEPPKPNKPVQKDFIDEMETIKKGANIDKKVNAIDYFRTPDRVLEKIGMKKEANGIRMAYDDYKADLKSEIGRITKWYEQAPSPESSQRIFKYLDGQPVKLEGTELKVAKEIETYLADWAEKLGLPKDKRIANYITHIFDFDAAQKEFDPEIARLIQDRVPGSVYNPFLEKRLGKLGYKENVWQALDAYVKRATRKVNMDPALANLSKASEGLDIDTFNYVKRYGDRINMRPTEIDNLIDNMIKQSPVGYKYGSRPTTVLSSKIRQTVARATLGLNIGSAVKNLSQGVNTYAKLGEKYTVIGYTKLLGKMASKDLSELYDVGVLDDAVIQDRQLNAVKSVTQKLDSALFAMFDMAEKINRGSAYFGAKSKAISEGLNEEQAIEYAKKIVRDTQFTFGSVDTPVFLSPDIVKTLAQFQTYGLKQTEFLGEMVKEKDLKGLIRYTGASIALYMTVGKALGWNIKDIIPSVRLDSPAYQQYENVKTLLNPNETGNAKRKALIKQLKLVVPGGTQIGKTLEGFQTADQGYGTNAKGDFLYAVDQSPANKLKASVFGKNSLQETQSYYDSKSKSPLKQMAMTSDLGIPDLVKDFFKPKEKTPYQKAELKKLDEKKAEAELKTSDKGYVIVNDKLKTLTDTGGTNTLDYGKVASMPESTTMEKIKKQKEAFKIVDNVLNSSIDEGDKEEILMKLGVSRQDAEYYQLAQESDDVKMGYISDAAGTMKERKDYLTFLAKGRKQINGKMIVSDGVLKDLYDSKVITKDDYEKLKNIIFKDGQPFVKMTGRGKGARIKKIKLGTLSPRLKALVGSKSPSIDTSRLKIQQPQMAKLPQIYQMPQNLLS